MANYRLGGQGRDYDSKRSRETVINMIAEGSNDRLYRTIRSLEGLTKFGTPSSTRVVVRSNLLVNGLFIYVVIQDILFRYDEDGNKFVLGTVGGAGQATIVNNNVPGDNQILVLNGIGDGFIYEVGSATFTQITDVDFFSTTSVAILNERFWFSRDGTNEFFGSDISDGFSYDPLTFATAESDSDNVVKVVAKKSALYVVGTGSVEYWQSVDDTILPLRNSRSAGHNRGIISPRSLASWGDYFAFLADDGTVRLFNNTQMTKISDLELELRIRGNGTLTYPGFTTLEDAIGFFVDGPVHKIFYLTFPTEGYTWGYDLTTGISHERTSRDVAFWRANYSTLFNGQIIIGDAILGQLWVLDPSNNTEDGIAMQRLIRTPSTFFDKNVTIPLVEIDMEVGQIADPNIEPLMRVKYSKDGGYNYIAHDTISLGKQGDYRKRVPLRRFGRLIRNKDFILELEVTDDVKVQFYGAFANIQEDF